MSVTAPNLIGKPVSQAQNQLSSYNLKYKVVGNGDTVTRQVPAASTSVPAGGTVVLYTEKSSQQSMVVVPDFSGLTLSQANQKAAALGINIKIKGSSLESANTLSYTQSVEPGASIEVGSVITVSFRYIDQVE